MVTHSPDGVPAHVVVNTAAGEIWKHCRDRSATHEATTTRAAHKAALGLDGVVVPEVLAVDAQANRIGFEFLPGLIPFSGLIYARSTPIPAVMTHRCGEALASLHNAMLITEADRVALASATLAGLIAGPIHGDFTPINVCYQPTSRSIVVIDWSAGPQHDGDGNWGSQLWDLAWFANSVVRLSPAPLDYGQVSGLIDALIAGYSARSEDFDTSDFLRCLREVSERSRIRQQSSSRTVSQRVLDARSRVIDRYLRQLA